MIKKYFNIVIGADIAKKKFDVACLLEGKYKHKVFTNDAAGFTSFAVWLLSLCGDISPIICMEATGAYSLPLADYLVNHGFSVSLVNPAKIHAFAKSELSRAKTDTELKSTRKAIKDHIDNYPDLKQRSDLLETIPGIGEACIAHLLLALSEHHGFTHAKQVAAFAGLAPVLRESGQWRSNTHISKTGDSALRKVLYMPALCAKRYNPVIQVFWDRLQSNGKNGKAITCAAMRKLIHIAFGVIKSGKPFDPNYAI